MILIPSLRHLSHSVQDSVIRLNARSSLKGALLAGQFFTGGVRPIPSLSSRNNASSLMVQQYSQCLFQASAIMTIVLKLLELSHDQQSKKEVLKNQFHRLRRKI